jgi:uncharacterized glyoxalase superfamily protein PhnB
MAMPDGTVSHAEIEIGESVIMIGDENWPGGHEPRTLACPSWTPSATRCSEV